MSETLDTIEAPEFVFETPEVTEHKPLLTSHDVGKTIATTLIQVAVTAAVAGVAQWAVPKIKEARDNRKAKKDKATDGRLQNVS